MNMSEIIKKQLEAYQANFVKHGNSPLGTFQNNTTTQYERFNELLLPLLKIKPTDFSICDIGSGVCDLHHFLISNEVKHSYTGIEIVPEMVTFSQEKYPGITVLNTDFLSDDFTEKYDFVVLSGTFNIHGGVNESDWKDFVFKLIKKMFESARLGISFNLLTSYSTFRDETLFYASPEEVLTYIQTNLSRFCTINSAYPLFEFSYTVFTKECMKITFSHPDFDKYLK